MLFSGNAVIIVALAEYNGVFSVNSVVCFELAEWTCQGQFNFVGLWQLKM